MIPFANETEEERAKTSYKINQLANKLGITVPIRFTKDPKLLSPFSQGGFFTTNLKYTSPQSIQQQIYSTLKSLDYFDENPYFCAFGQALNSSTFDLYYVNDNLRYVFSAHVSGAQDTSNEISETVGQINQAFRFLNQVLTKDRIRGKAIYSINDNGDKDTVFCKKYDPNKKEWTSTTTCNRSEFI